MNTRNLTPVIVAVLVFVVGWPSFIFADTVYIYGKDDFDLPIPANPDDTRGWMTDAVIRVDDHFTIYDIDVAISLKHTHIFDLQLFLQSPFGARLCLNMYDFKREYFRGQDYTQTVFDDEALFPIERGRAPFTGRFRPRAGNLLRVFDGKDAYGLWQLQIYDAYYYDTGILNSCKIMITTPEPATAILLSIGAALMRLRKRPKQKL